MHRITSAALFFLVLAGCEGEVTAPEDTPSEGTLVIAATSATDFVYVSLEDDGRVVQVADPATSTDWDIAFRRYLVKVNGGVGGPGNVAAASVGPNTNKTAEQIAALTPANAVTAFSGVTAANIATATFREDGVFEDDMGRWFQINTLTGRPVANPGAAWKLREADGDGFALIRVSSLELEGELLKRLTLQYRRQAVGGTLAALDSLSVTVGATPTYVDLSTGAVVSGTGCDWDLAIHSGLVIEVNADCDAGTFPLDTENFNTLTRADDAPEYGPYLSVIAGAIPNSIDDATGLFWYNLQGGNRLWPTYNVFLIRKGDDVYKIQVTDYYSATGASGYITLRFEQIR